MPTHTKETRDSPQPAPASGDGSVKTLVYLATPYSHPDVNVREARFAAVNKVAAELMRKGMHIYSPISHTHPIALAGGLPIGWDYWKAYDRAILSACCKLIILMLPGWEHSSGISGELATAHELDIPVEYLSPNAAGEPQQQTEAESRCPLE